MYRTFKKTAIPEEQPESAAGATVDQLREYNSALSPGRHVGSEEPDEKSEPFAELIPELV